MKRPNLFSKGLLHSLGLIVLAGLTALPVTADEIDDLKRQIEILAQKIEMLEAEQAREEAALAGIQERETGTVAVNDVVMRGDRRNSWKIPGTDTSMSIGGRLEASLIYDFGPRPTSRGGDIGSVRSAILEDQPEFDIRGETRFTARNSRFNIITTTPTRFGLLRTFIEGDFNGPPNSKRNRATTNRTAFGIRHAYGQLGNVLFGHYWSTYMDRTVFPTKINGTGPVGRTFIRQGQLRYTRNLGDGGQWVFALENPFSDFDGADDENMADGYPDVVSFYRYESDRWHMQFTGLLRRMGINEGIAGGVKDYATGWGINQSASFRLPWNDDRVTWYVNFGNGIGRYLDGGANQGVSITPDGKLDTQFGYGGFVSYRHWWSETFSSSIDFGMSRFDLNPEEVDDANRKLFSSHLNLIWEPQDELQFGIEYIWGKREVKDGRQGKVNRTQFTTRIFF